MEKDITHHDEHQISVDVHTATQRVTAHHKDPDYAHLVEEARIAMEQEHKMSIFKAIRLYPKAVGWSVLLSTALIMEGYDTLLIGNFFALPQFQRRFGALQPDGTYVLSASWRSGLSNGASVGEIIGLQFTGIFQDRFGYRKTMLGALVWVAAMIFLVFFAQNISMLLAGEILCGMAWGAFQTITTAYASEVCPVALRAYLTTYVNLCWVIGQFIGSGVLRGVLTLDSEWAYRIPFAIQWIWPVPLIIGCYFAPESPWWCVQHGDIEGAKHNLRRLTSPNSTTDFDVDRTIAMIEYTNETEQELTAGTSYWDCFKGPNLRRTEIVCIVWLNQHLCGSTFMGYSTNFYEAAGLPVKSAFDLSMGQYAIGAAGTILSWFVMAWLGRRQIYFSGISAISLILFIIGFVSLAPEHPARDWAIGSMLLIFTFVYDCTLGPVCYSLVSEISSTRLRAKSIVLARNVYNIGGIVTHTLSNYQLTTTAWNWGAHTGFFWGGIAALCAVWTFFRVPEPKGRAYVELDMLFEKGVSARKFQKMEVDILGVVEEKNKGGL